jgi:hypothetical protein
MGASVQVPQVMIAAADLFPLLLCKFEDMRDLELVVSRLRRRGR